MMNSFLRNTALGMVVRLLSSDRSLSFPDHALLEATTETKTVGLEAKSLNEWESADDPENPQNWTMAKKVFVTTLICTYTFTVYCGSSIYVPSETQVIEEFHISATAASLGLALYVLGYGLGPLLFSPLSEVPAIGRNPIYIITFAIFVGLCVAASLCQSFTGFLVIRFLQGFLGSPCLATGAATLSDMFPVLQIPYPLAAWSGSMYCGPALGPVISAFAVSSRGWRWSMWELLWLAGPVFLAMFCFLPETSSWTLLYYRARRLQQTTTGSSLTSSQAGLMQEGPSIGRMIQLALVKPFEITIKDPAVAFANFYTSLTYGIYYSFFEVFPLVYPRIYDFAAGETGAVFVCIFIACLIGVIWYCAFYRILDEPRFRRNNNSYDVQDSYLRPGLVAVFGLTAGLFLFGWAARPDIPWPVPTLGIVIYCSCSFVVGLGIFIYLPLSYPRYSASLFAANDALRSTFACAAVLFGRPMYLNLGVGKSCSLLGGLSVLGIVGYWYLYRYGAWMRGRSTFTEK